MSLLHLKGYGIWDRKLWVFSEETVAGKRAANALATTCFGQ